MEELKRTGGIEKLSELIKNDEDVWIKRSSGAWQKGKVEELGHRGLSAKVSWHDEVKDKKVGKHVETVDFLKWQEENQN